MEAVGVNLFIKIEAVEMEGTDFFGKLIINIMVEVEVEVDVVMVSVEKEDMVVAEMEAIAT